MPHYHTIFAAVDGAGSIDIAQKALHLAEENNAALCLGHVVDSLGAEVAGANLEARAASARTRIERDLADVLEQARQNPAIPSVELAVEAGPVIDVLEKSLIRTRKPDLVICGQRGLSNLKYTFVGSVSTHLIRNLRCDVLVVKPRSRQAS